MKKNLLIVFCVLATFNLASAQDKITLNDVLNIRSAAKTTLYGMPKLLNQITLKETGEGVLAENELRSFQLGSKTRIFYDNHVVISDDVDPHSSKDSTKDVKIEDYFSELDTQYPKTDEESIEFLNLEDSHIKRNNDFTYILIKFDSKFNQPPYTVKKRFALLQVDRSEGRWTAYISTIHFYDPAHPIGSTDNDVPVFRDTSASAGALSAGELNKLVDSTENVSNAEIKRNEARYNQLLAAGNNAFADRHYADAVELYDQALDLKPLDIVLDNKIRETKRLIDQNTYSYLKNKGDQYKAERRYVKAIYYYQHAQEQKPDANLSGTEIKDLRSVLVVVSPPNSMLDSKEYQQAIEECKKLIKAHKNVMANFPELYFIMGKGYEGLYINKPEDPGSKDGVPRNDNLKEALKNYKAAIDAFPNYIDALMARANFYVRYLNDYARAISDYELVIEDATDDNPEKPGYYATEAKWKEFQQNYTDALDYYSRAIALSGRTDSLYLKKGELLYRLKRYDEAKTAFDMAIKLNPKYNAAYFYRGLNFIASENARSAGSDFAKLTTLGASYAQSQTIDSLSNGYFLQGEAMYNQNHFDAADIDYGIALALKNCNTDALHAQAKISFTEALESYKHGKADDSRRKFLRSIVLNNLAIACNPAFSDAYFKNGLAQYHIAEYDQAIKSYTQAIGADAKNVDAYIERGNTYQTQNNYTKAAENYDQATALLSANLELAKRDNVKNLITAINFKLSLVNQLGGTSHYCTGDYANAMIYLNKAIEINDQNAEAFYYRGLVNEVTNEVSKAIRDYNEALKISKDYRYYYAIGKAYFKTGKYEESIANFNSAINTDSAKTVKNRYYLRGLSLFKNEKYDQAVSDYSEYDKYEGAKTDTAFYVDYGYAELYADRDTSANKHFNKALALNPNNAKAWYGLGCAYAKALNFDKALENIEKSFVTRQLRKDDIKLYDGKFLDKLKDNKASRNKYNELKKTYLNN